MRTSAKSLAFLSVAFVATSIISAAAMPQTSDSETGVAATLRKSISREQLARIDMLETYLKQLQTQINRAQFDVDSLLNVLDYDPEDIIAFAKKEVHFEQYPGLLRGAEGTLMSRAGNALDQSVLLATLLRDAGLDARIQRGVLPNDVAQELINQLASSHDQASPFKNTRDAEAVVLSMAKAIGFSEVRAKQLITPPSEDLSWADTVQYRDAKSTSDRLGKIIYGSRPVTAQADIANRISEEAQDYFWVEYRLGPGYPWASAHPAFPDVGMEQELAEIEPIETFADQIPERLQHRVRFQAFIEQRLGKETVEHLIAGPYERPAANISGKPIEFSIFPMDMFATDHIEGDTLDKAIRDSTYFVSVLFDGAPRATAYFDLAGSPVDPFAGGSPAAGVVNTVGGRFGQAAGALAGEDNPEDFIRLNKIWMQYEIIAPGGNTTTHVRTLYDRAQLPAESSGIGQHIAQSATFMPMVGSLSPAYVLNANLEKLVSLLPAFKLTIASWLEGMQVSATKPKFKAMNNRWIGHLQLYSIFDQGDSLFADNAHSYRSGTNIVVYQETLSSSAGQVAIDIVSNERRAFIRGARGPTFSPELMMQLGVWETRVEGLLTGGSENSRFNVFVAFENARASGAELMAITSHEAEKLDELALSPEALGNAKRDLAEGFTLVIPRLQAADAESTGWWRVNAETGQTLGMGGDGRGVEITESMVAQVIFAGGATFVGCTAWMFNNGATLKGTVIQCGKLSLGVGAMVAAGSIWVAAARAAAAESGVGFIGAMQAEAGWAAMGVGGLFLNALLDLWALDPTQ